MTRTALLAIAAAVALTGCVETRAGLSPDSSFGAAVDNNNLVQSVAFAGPALLAKKAAAFDAETANTINFAFDRANLDASARAALKGQANWLKANPDVRVRVFGHTDLVGGERYNDRLGLQRARAAARYLVRLGIARDRVDAVESRGERDPLVVTEAPERLNRRTTTEVAGFTHGFVGDGMDGRRAQIMYNRYATDTVEKPSITDSDSE